MKTDECVKRWVASMVNGDTVVRLNANSCSAVDSFFVSYSTPVARYRNGVFEVASRKYSSTTSRLQGYIRREIPDGLMKVVNEVDGDGLFPWRR